MFDSFKRPKRVKNSVGTAYPLIAMYCRDENGKLDERLFEDEFAIAYIFGMVSFNINMMGIKNPTEAGLIINGAFEILFEDKANQIMAYCSNQLDSPDKVFSSIVNIATKELTEFRTAIMQYGKNTEAKLHIQKHLSEFYT